MTDKYILDKDGNPELLEGDSLDVSVRWDRWLAENEQRCRVGLWSLNGVDVSTVFLAMDYGMGSLLLRAGVVEEKPPPELFETLIVGGKYSRTVHRRYSTMAEAVAGHEAAIKMVIGDWVGK